MTIGEVKLVTETYLENKKQEMKMNNIRIYNIAYLTSTFVGLILDGKKPPKINTIFPDTEEDAKTDGVDNEVILVRERLKEFAMNANKQRRR